MDVALLLMDPALKAFFPFILFMVTVGMLVLVLFAVLQVVLLFLDGASRVLGQPAGFLVPAFF